MTTFASPAVRRVARPLAAALLLVPGAALPAQQPAAPETAAAPAAAGRVRYTINDGWSYFPDGFEFAEKEWTSDAGWQRVNLPHSWNAADPFDDVESYRRGVSWYRKRLALPDSLRGKRLFLYFEGVNQVADVYVNGAYAGGHKGGYTAFALDVTRWARFDGKGNENLVAVQVNNAHDPAIPPLSVGYALYGGIYRDVWLVATDPAHVTLADHGGSGVYVTTPSVSRDRAEVRVRGTLANDGAAARRLRAVSTILDRDGRAVGEASSAAVLVGPGRQAAFAQRFAPLRSPRLWSPDDPYLYTVRTDVYDDGGALVDRVRSPLGLRWFRFDPDRGFLLNGEKLVLRGTNRHQDYQGLGPALSDAQHARDLEIIKEMGANFLRLAHYPQDPAVLDAADRLGLLVWEEVPVVNYITVSDEFTANARRALREMIRQHYNHPSVVLWGTMNEVFLWSEAGERIARQSDTTYMREVRDFARGMDSVARAEDPSRATSMAIHGATSYDSAGVADVPQVLGLNLYNGWYGGTVDEYGGVLDRRHARSPRQAIVVSEYGSGSELRLNSAAPERFDHSGSYHRFFHESYLRQARARPWLAGTAIWNQFDFSQPHIGETTPNLNKKGMLTFDRRTKDVYYLYKANWNPAPMVYIASRDWTHRAGVASPRGERAAAGDAGPAAGAEKATVEQPVDVYSNLDRVELFVDGRSLGVRQPDDVRKASWVVPFAAGDNVLEARGEKDGRPVVDRLVVRFDLYPADLRDAAVPFRELAVNVGSNAQYADDDGVVFLPDQPYRAGSYGHVGGKAAMLDRNVVITGTRKTPLYFTYRAGLDAYRVDVPDGEYEVELMFADPADARVAHRAFDVAVNGRRVAGALAPPSHSATTVATPVTVRGTAAGGRGLTISFTAIRGEPILNALRVRKL